MKQPKTPHKVFNSIAMIDWTPENARRYQEQYLKHKKNMRAWHKSMKKHKRIIEELGIAIIR